MHNALTFIFPCCINQIIIEGKLRGAPLQHSTLSITFEFNPGFGKIENYIPYSGVPGAAGGPWIIAGRRAWRIIADGTAQLVCRVRENVRHCAGLLPLRGLTSRAFRRLDAPALRKRVVLDAVEVLGESLCIVV